MQPSNTLKLRYCWEHSWTLSLSLSLSLPRTYISDGQPQNSGTTGAGALLSNDCSGWQGGMDPLYWRVLLSTASRR